MVLASTTMRPNDLVEVGPEELEDWRRRGILLQTKAETAEGRMKAALRQSPIDGPSATTPVPDAAEPDSAEQPDEEPDDQPTEEPAKESASHPAKTPAKKAAQRRRTSKTTASPTDGGAQTASANTEAAPPRENEAPEGQKENDQR